MLVPCCKFDVPDVIKKNREKINKLIMNWILLLCVVGVIGSPTPAEYEDYEVIVVGMGAAGSTAASTLARAGRRVLALEASDRIGGRVHTVHFGEDIVEMGAEWIHGTEKSRSYQLAIQNKITILPQGREFQVFRSNGSEVDNALMLELLTFCFEVLDEHPEPPESIGHLITRRLNEYINKTKHQLDEDFVENFLLFIDQIVNNIEASNSFNDVTTASAFEELGGNQEMSWHKHGYKTLFEILMNTYNNGPGLPSLTVKLNSEVTQIKWPKSHSEPVEVTAEDGTVYKARYAIVTVSLGVLKERYLSLFNPPLPQNKTRAIDFISFGVVGKVTFRFPYRWCETESCLFVWKTEDIKKIPEEDKWLTQSEGVTVPMSCKTCVTLWLNGNRAKLVELMSADRVIQKVMAVIRQFMVNTTIPEPLEMIRSRWYTNPLTRGSYSYDNINTPTFPNVRSVLAAPLPDAAGKPRVLFAGEATNPTHFSTVHGAMETGAREAERILNDQADYAATD